MATRKPTLSECMELELGPRAMTIMCDDCGKLIDAIQGYWLEQHSQGKLYAGSVLCWRCTSKLEDKK